MPVFNRTGSNSDFLGQHLFWQEIRDFFLLRGHCKFPTSVLRFTNLNELNAEKKRKRKKFALSFEFPLAEANY